MLGNEKAMCYMCLFSKQHFKQIVKKIKVNGFQFNDGS